ncbi:hypothetical protein [Burkholderia pyrrocinia]|uniref:hypothetical protein n=1 Tax=Burkholderia TaxID=32008 RepID=UPI00215AE07B|nr:hypothetical protein [Burkholderia pyrrocinia]UVE64722.1 hypothetical protein L2Y90_12750 [Burkholderia pyrrocinia]
MGDKGNTVGRLYGQAAMSSAPASSANPPVKAETPEEEGWFSKWWGNTKHELSEAADHPWEATKGAVKGIANIPSDIGELLIKGSTLQTAGEMEQAAAMQSVFGQTQSAEALTQAAQDVKASAGSIELPKFKMSNAAQAGGDKIVTAVSLAAGGAGIVKGGIRGVAALGKVGAAEGVELSKTATATGKVLQAEGTIAEGTKAADVPTAVGKAAGATDGVGAGGAAGDGAKVLKPAEAKLKPGTPEHKASRWERYKARGGKKDYEAWSKQYDTNMRNYQFGAARESAYREAMDASEGTLKTPLTNRQIDILKADEMYAGQLKTGPVSLTKENILAIQKDGELVKQGWQVEHILEQGASKPYLDALEKAGVDAHIGPKIP